MSILTFQSNFTKAEWDGDTLWVHGKSSPSFLASATQGIYIGLRLRSDPAGNVSSYKVKFALETWSVPLTDLPSKVLGERTSEMIFVGVGLQDEGEPLVWTAVLTPTIATAR